MRHLGGGAGVVSTSSIRIPDYEKSVLKSNGLSVFGRTKERNPWLWTAEGVSESLHFKCATMEAIWVKSS